LAKGHPVIIQNGGDIADGATYIFYYFLKFESKLKVKIRWVASEGFE
jgi:hypothetical protein